MRTLRQRVLLTFVSTAVGAGCGMLGGYLLGSALTVRHAAAGLDPFASRILEEAETSANAARATLASVNHPPYPLCSGEEIDWLRRLVFESQYVKDAGRIRDGKIVCSATLGRLEHPSVLPRADFSHQDGARVYRNLAPFRIAGLTVIAVQMGDAYIVYNPWDVKNLGAGSFMHFTFTESDLSTGQIGRLLGESPRAGPMVLFRDGHARVGDTLYTTLCSTRFASCITAYVSIPEALRADRAEFSGYIALSGLCGSVLGLAWALLYRRNKSIERQLRRAIRRDALEVMYQPIVELASGMTAGAEALVRWTDEDGFAISPEVFEAIAEERGFVGDITRLVVRRTLRDFRRALQQRAGFRVNVNIAAGDLSDATFLPDLERCLEQAGVPARSLGIEITESSTARKQTAKEAILHLRRMGHVVYVDDFGTGYSSLAYLHDLAVDGIKIDRAFTGAIGTAAVTETILPQILAMAASLRLQVVVEGVETEEQARYFASSGRTILAQGWLFGRPLSLEDFLRRMASEEMHQPEAVGAA